MPIERILVPIDFSASSQAVVEYATTLAVGAHASLLFAHVIVPPAEFAAPPDTGEGQPYSLASQRDPGGEQLQRIVPSARDVPYSHYLLSGDPAERIAELAARERADLIVIGSHGHSALARLLLGSVTEAVVRTATCPVLIVRLPALAKSAHE